MRAASPEADACLTERTGSPRTAAALATVSAAASPAASPKRPACGPAPPLAEQPRMLHADAAVHDDGDPCRRGLGRGGVMADAELHP